MRWLGFTIVGVLSTGCWGGWGENPCGDNVVIVEGSRWTNPNTGDQLIFENGQAVFRPASGSEALMDVQGPPADFLPIDCRFGDGRPAAHAVRRFGLVTEQGKDVLLVRAQSDLRFSETASVAGVLEIDDRNNVRRNRIVLNGSVDAAGTTLSIPLVYDKPLSGSVNVSVVVQLELEFVDEDGVRQQQTTEINLGTSCFDGECIALSSYPPVECL